MRVLINNLIDGSSFHVQAPPGMNPVRIGLDERNAVVLPSNYVPAEAAALANNGDGWEFWSLCQGRWRVNDRRLTNRERVLWLPEHLYQFDRLFTLSVFLEPHDRPTSAASRQQLSDRYSDVVRDVHQALNKSMNEEFSAEGADPKQRLSDAYIIRLEQRIDELAAARDDLPRDDMDRSDLGDYIAATAVRAEMARRLVESSGESVDSLRDGAAADSWRTMRSLSPTREAEILRLIQGLSSSLGVDGPGDLTQKMERFEGRFWQEWEKLAPKTGLALRRYLLLRQIKKEIKDIWYGYGPLEDLLENPTIKEIMVNDSDHIFIEHGNTIENSGRRFVSEQVTRAIIEKIVSRVGRRIDTSEPLVDARLTDGSRVNAVIPPLAIKGPCLTIRRFPTKRLEADDLVRIGSLTPPAKCFLQSAVINRRNILVAGGTGSGKTTLLNCLSGFIPDKERIITIEDTAELRLQKEHVVSLEVKQKNAEGKGAVTIRDLVKNSLRMRPDRIVVGECRGPEALDMLQAMNTGHDGSMTTLHANNPSDVVLRLEVLVNMGQEKLPIESIRRQIVSAIDLIVQLRVVNRNGKKQKVVSQIAEVVALEADGSVRVAALFDRKDDFAELRATGSLPTFLSDLLDTGSLELETFLC